MARDYAIYDVFTDRKLAGNPLAVIFDGGGLSDEMMQTIAGEMNLSETVFVLPPTMLLTPPVSASSRRGANCPLPVIRPWARR